MQERECPMCGERMRLIERKLSDKIAGTDELKATTVAEWTCPECDYFDEADDSDE